MRVRGLNREHTKNPSEVAFELSFAPDMAIASPISLKGIQWRLDGHVLVLKTECQPLPVTSDHADAFLNAYINLEDEAKQEEREKVAARQKMLEQISIALRMPFTDQLSDED